MTALKTTSRQGQSLVDLAVVGQCNNAREMITVHVLVPIPICKAVKAWMEAYTICPGAGSINCRYIPMIVDLAYLGN